MIFKIINKKKKTNKQKKHEDYNHPWIFTFRNQKT